MKEYKPTLQNEINSLKYQINKRNQYIIKYSRFDKNGSHKEAILKIMDQKKVLVLELKELEMQLAKEKGLKI